jgi:hypothetical protein
MSYFPREPQKPKYKHLLVFDTSALLSANEKDRTQVWRNNEQLGDCYVPGATYAEIGTLSRNNSRPKEQAKAKAFLDFVQKGGRYKIQPIEDNSQIPTDNIKDRQILACAYRLAEENKDCVVILVTYDNTMKGLVTQSNKPNFCTLEGEELGRWFYQNYYEEKVPKAVYLTYGRMERSRRSNSPGLPGRSNQSLPGNQYRESRTSEGKKPPRIINQSYESESPKVPKQLPNSSRQFESPIPKPEVVKEPPILITTGQQSNTQTKTLIIAGAILLGIVAGTFVIGSFTRKDSNPPTGVVIPQAAQAANPQSTLSTSSELIAQADNGISRFQQTRDASALLEPLNQLQRLKNSQGGKLDTQGEQKLSRLKHKYALEVLAERNQVAEATDLLQQVPNTYYDYEKVKEWLSKHK